MPLTRWLNQFLRGRQAKDARRRFMQSFVQNSRRSVSRLPAVELLEGRCLLSGTPLTSDVNTLLLLPFDGGLNGSGGESPLENAGITFETGLVGQAVHTGDPGFVRYSTNGNIDAAQGTIEFWIKPDWNGNTGESHNFFEVGDNFNNGILLSIDGANNLRFIEWGDDPTTADVEVDRERGIGVSGSDWIAGEWHHLAATWNAASGHLGLYIDGRQVGTADNGITIDHFSTNALTIGAESGNQTPADAAFDEFRISNSVRTAAEINDDYRAGLGLPSVLHDPRGMAVDSANRSLVAETGVNRIGVFNSDGVHVANIGSTGTEPGKLNGPTDVAVDASDNILVLDSGNGRVQSFDRDGNFLSTFGTSGSGAGQLLNAQGLFVDPDSGKIYVADTGNQRVLRFLANGTLDPSWGGDGSVGVTGAVERDHTGFDQPTDVAVNPITGEVYVADYGNQRLEVFDSTGHYVHSYLAVYRPNALAFSPNGDLYIAGEDPNEGYTAYDGRLRLLKAGDELISAHYTGGLDDIERIETGVAVRSDGAIVFVDNLNGRVVRTDAEFTTPLTDLKIDARGTEVTLTWKTAQPQQGSVRFGTSPTGGQEVTDPNISTEHQVTITGLTENSRLYYSVSFPDSFDGSKKWTAPDPINSGSLPGTSQFLRIKAAGVIYTDSQSGPGYTRIDAAALADMHSRYERLADFYWRNSGFKLWFDITVVEVDKDLTDTPYDLFANMGPDLATLGYSADDDFDAAWGASVLTGGNFGGGGNLFGRFVGMCEWVTQDDFVAIHEVNHTIDSIYDSNGLKKYEFNHGIWAVPNGIGEDFTVNGQILRNFLPANFTATVAPFTKVLTAPDLDNDGVPDSSPAGLTHPFSITEATLGSSTSLADSDGDGVSDLQEAIALPYGNTNLMVKDSDGDGVADGADLNPAYAMDDQIDRGTPTVDGTISPDEGWTVVTNKVGYSNQGLVSDNNEVQNQVTTYAAWNDQYLFLALKGPPGETQLKLDGSADNWYFGPDNYSLRLRNDESSLDVAVNVGVPDVFRQIDDDGQYSTFLDTDPQFTKPYAGHHFFDQPDQGLGFPGRLVAESDLIYRRGGSGNESVWEVAIPFSNKTLLKGFAGKEMAIEITVNGDRLFNVDHAARLQLIAAAPIAPIAHNGVLEVMEDHAKSGTLVITDPDSAPEQLTISVVTNPLHGQVQITNVHTGAYTYTPAPNYDGPDSFTFRATDGDQLSNTATMLITVTPVNHLALISGQATGALTENGVTTIVTGKLTVTDSDPGESLFQTPSNLDAVFGAFTFDPQTGDWSYTLDNNRAATNALTAGQTATDSLIVRSKDGTANETLTVTVTGVDDSPSIVLNPQPLIYNLKSKKVVALDAAANFLAPDAPPLNFNQSILKVSGQLPKDSLSIIKQGPIKLQGSKIFSGKTQIGTVSGGTKAKPLSITFTTGMTQDVLQTLLRSIGFKTTDKKPTTTRTISVQITNLSGNQSTNTATRDIQLR